jgi:peptide-methionine (R)-S-oxide reductase
MSASMTTNGATPVNPETTPTDRHTKTDEQWREQLTPEQYDVLRRGGTEPPFSGEYAFTKDDGMYRCAACGHALFSSDAKFESGTGWPSFTEPAFAENVTLLSDKSHGIWATSSTMAPVPRASVSASTRRR